MIVRRLLWGGIGATTVIALGIGSRTAAETGAYPTGRLDAASAAPLADAAPALPDRLPTRVTTPSSADAASIARLTREIDGALAQGSYRRADWGVLVRSIDRGDVLYARNADEGLAPASNLKVVTSVAALHHLGPDFRFQTWLFTDAPVRDGVVHGDVVVYGTGDPGLGDRFYRTRAEPWQRIATQLRDAGIREIRGRVVGDGTFFSGPTVLVDEWEAEDLNAWYGAASTALSYNENVASLRIEPGAPGGPPLVHSIPEHTGQPIVNQGRTVTGRPRWRISFLREDPADAIRVEGEIRAGSRDVWRQMTISDPILFAAHGLTHVLRDEGIEVSGEPGTVDRVSGSPVGERRLWMEEGAPRLLAELRSPPLSEYLTAVNRRSHNLFADLMLKALGRAVEGQGSYAAGARVLTRFLVDELGVPQEPIHLVDGSGLAPANRVSPAALVASIEFARAAPWGPAFFESLPEAGSRGFRRMRGTAAAGNLRAKTGTIADVSALTGIVRTAGGEELAFSIVGNDLPSETGAKRVVEDRIGAYLAQWRRGDAR